MQDEEIRKIFKNCNYGISVEQKNTYKTGIRIRPWIETKNITRYNLKEVKVLLLNRGINISIVNKKIKLQGYSNCKLLSEITKTEPYWWRKIMEMIKNEEHLHESGIKQIINIRNKFRGRRGTKTKWTKNKAEKYMYEKS